MRTSAIPASPFVAAEPAHVPTCGVCGQPLGQVGLTRCSICETPYHEECGAYIAGCPRFACMHSATPRRRLVAYLECRLEVDCRRVGVPFGWAVAVPALALGFYAVPVLAAILAAGSPIATLVILGIGLWYRRQHRRLGELYRLRGRLIDDCLTSSQLLELLEAYPVETVASPPGDRTRSFLAWRATILRWLGLGGILADFLVLIVHPGAGLALMLPAILFFFFSLSFAHLLSVRQSDDVDFHRLISHWRDELLEMQQTGQIDARDGISMRGGTGIFLKPGVKPAP